MAAIMTTTAWCALGVACVAIFSGNVQAKVEEGSFKLEAGDFDSFPLKEITKFSFGVGTSVVKGQFRYPTMTPSQQYQKSPALLLIDDTQWEKYHDNKNYPTCLDKVSLSAMQIRIGSSSHVGVGHSGLSNVNDVESNVKRSLSHTVFEFKWIIEQIDRTHGWFVVVSDCALEQYQGEDKMDYRLEFVNEGDNHASAEEHGLLTVYLVSLVLLIVSGIYGMILIGYHVEETERNVHLVVILLSTAFLLMTTGIMCESLHLFLESYTGTGIAFFDYTSELLEMGSYMVIAFVLISLASGWTLIDQEADQKNEFSVLTILRDPKKMVQGFNAAVVSIIFFVIVSMILIIVNKQSDNSFHKFHDFESTPGKILLAMRVVLGGLFAASMWITIKSMNTTKQLADDVTLRNFLYRLLFVGTTYFLSFPLAVYIAETALPFYERHRFVEGSVILSQAWMLILLAYQFLSKSSVYRRLSTVWESGLLPTAGGLQSTRKIYKE